MPPGNRARATSPAKHLARTVYEGLRDEIVGGKIRPGQVLSRRQIASRYGTSYIPVMEAMVRLEEMGLLDVEARQITRVRPVNLETIQEAYVLREAYETQAIRLAVIHATREEIDQLQVLAKVLDDFVAAGGARSREEKKGLLLHWKFHRRLAEISRSSALVQELERIELFRRLQANWFYIPAKPDPARCHGMLVDAIAARDPVKADALMREHVRNGLDKEILAYRAHQASNSSRSPLE